MGYTWGIHGIYIRYTWDIHGIYIGYTWHLEPTMADYMINMHNKRNGVVDHPPPCHTEANFRDGYDEEERYLKIGGDTPGCVCFIWDLISTRFYALNSLQRSLLLAGGTVHVAQLRPQRQLQRDDNVPGKVDLYLRQCRSDGERRDLLGVGGHPNAGRAGSIRCGPRQWEKCMYTLYLLCYVYTKANLSLINTNVHLLCL